MTRDIVIVPTYDRPEYLWVCLQKLSAAHGVQDKEIWVCEDNHSDGKDGWATFNMVPVMEEARRLFKQFRVYLACTPQHVWKQPQRDRSYDRGVCGVSSQYNT